MLFSSNEILVDMKQLLWVFSRVFVCGRINGNEPSWFITYDDRLVRAPCAIGAANWTSLSRLITMAR